MSITVGGFGSAVRSNLVAVSQTNLAWATLLDVGPPERGRRRLHDRLAHALRTAIRDGRLAEDAAVPPSRALAEELGCSRWVVTEAYAQLIAEGYLSARVGSATRVSWSPDTAPSRPRAAAPPARPPIRYDLAPGLPDLRAFPRRRWADAVRAVTGSAVHYDLGLPDPAGHRCCVPPSHGVPTALARRGRARRVRVRVRGRHRRSGPHVPSAARRGHRRPGRGTPGLGRLLGRRDERRPARAPGARGPRRPPRRRPRAYPGRAVVVGAAHQFPTGTVLSPARRARLVRWARRWTASSSRTTTTPSSATTTTRSPSCRAWIRAGSSSSARSARRSRRPSAWAGWSRPPC